MNKDLVRLLFFWCEFSKFRWVKLAYCLVSPFFGKIPYEIKSHIHKPHVYVPMHFVLMKITHHVNKYQIWYSLIKFDKVLYHNRVATKYLYLRGLTLQFEIMTRA